MTGNSGPERDSHGPAPASIPAPAPADAGPAAAGPAGPAHGAAPQLRGTRGFRRSIWVMEHAQDGLTITVGSVLIILAAILMYSGIREFVLSSGPVLQPATALLDRALLVLIIVEIGHTVVLSLRAHRLIAQPFIVIGLVAVIRRILSLFIDNKTQVTPSTLALLIAMVLTFVVALIAVMRFEKPAE